jgi:hypothetical protein
VTRDDASSSTSTTFSRDVAGNQCEYVTPAMEAGIADHVWSIEEIVGLLEGEHQ